MHAHLGVPPSYLRNVNQIACTGLRVNAWFASTLISRQLGVALYETHVHIWTDKLTQIRLCK